MLFNRCFRPAMLVCQLMALVIATPMLSTSAEPPAVILKLDDFGPSGSLMNDGWQITSDFLAERNVKASYGMIGKSIERSTPSFSDWVRRQHASGMIEFWNHGYTHGKRSAGDTEVAEFREPYATQVESLRKTQEIGKEKFDITFDSFGAPFNAINADTSKALQNQSELSVWLYGNERVAAQGGFTGVVLPRQIDLETPVHQPNFEAFKTQFERGSLGPCIVLQGHPASWAKYPVRFENFVQIVDFLQEKGCVFTTPSEYVASLK